MIGSSGAMCVMNYWAISDKVILVHINRSPFNICIMQVHAPTIQQDEDALNKFYEEVSLAKGQSKQHEVTFVMGDFNAKARSEKFEHVVDPY